MSASNNLLDVRAIQRQASQLALKLGREDFILADGPSGDGTPYVEVDDAYYYVREERGRELERRQTADLDELLFWVFSSVTFTMACNWEARHRREGEDFRRQLFAKQEELLETLSPQWARREALNHSQILRQHPFRDR